MNFEMTYPIAFGKCLLGRLAARKLAGFALAVVAALSWGLTSEAWAAQDAKGVSSADVGSAATTLDELYGEFARVRAELLSARSQVPPDWQKIGKLTAELASLRAEIAKRQQAGGVAGRLATPPAPWCPWGVGAGPGLGLGRQLGRGPAAGPRGGFGGRTGPGGGRRGGPGPAGAGWGRGLGPRGPGLGFVDQNGNGICDYFEVGLR
ncbi:MAG: hypothetical protein NZ899_11350 [Thermoguttaceae bacterium]|nr:hypothetical protein [Thermoguttaceae bacterium]MDW8077788.1 hypothetical protein [Thermoguttaceae bacterium]